MRKLISTTLQGQSWDSKNREQQKAWCKEIGERVKARMLGECLWSLPRCYRRQLMSKTYAEIQPTGFKFVVTTIINENRGQGGRADMVCHWEDSDVVAQEMWANVSASEST